jgi:AcrR family transcriptional regulator
MAAIEHKKPRARSKEDRDAVRERICLAAAKLFVEGGPDGFSMRSLATEVGCSPMAVYRYFPTKDALLAALRTAALDRLSVALESVTKENRHKARDVGDAYIRFALESPESYKLIFDVAQPDESQFPDLIEAGRRAHWNRNQYVRELVASGAIEGDPEVIGFVFWATMHGLIMLMLAKRIPNEPSFETIRKTALGALMRGFRP